MTLILLLQAKKLPWLDDSCESVELSACDFWSLSLCFKGMHAWVLMCCETSSMHAAQRTGISCIQYGQWEAANWVEVLPNLPKRAELFIRALSYQRARPSRSAEYCNEINTPPRIQYITRNGASEPWWRPWVFFSSGRSMATIQSL